MKIYGLAVCAALVLLSGPAVAGEIQDQPYSKCEVTGQKVEDCMLGCKTKEICAKEGQAIEALSEATEVTFYVMDGSPGGDEPELGGYIPLEHKNVSGDLAKEVAGNFRASLLSGNFYSMCFFPHHALSIKTEDHLYEYVLCYDCNQMEIYIDSSYVSRITTTGDPEAMNALVLKAGMTLPADYLKRLEWEKVGPP